MEKAPVPPGDDERLAILHAMAILDTPREERFDKITKAATEYFKVPISTISLIDKNREWYKSCRGIPEREGSRETSFCGHALFSEHEVFIVEDALKDKRFADNPAVIGPPFIRFYAGVALHDRISGQRVGVLCVKDIKTRRLDAGEVAKLLELAEQAEEELNKPLGT